MLSELFRSIHAKNLLSFTTQTFFGSTMTKKNMMLREKEKARVKTREMGKKGVRWWVKNDTDRQKKVKTW